MRMLRLAGIGLLVLCAGCPHKTVIPDARIPHQIADDAEVKVWCKVAEGWAKCEVKATQGWWLASPQVVDPKE